MQDLTLVLLILEDVAFAKGIMQANGLQPNEQAQPIIAERIWQYLEPVLGGLLITLYLVKLRRMSQMVRIVM